MSSNGQGGGTGSSGNGGKVAGGVGAAIVALVAGIGSVGDDIARVGGRVGGSILNSADDVGRTVVPFADAEDIVRSAGGPARVLGYDGADHRFSDPVLLERLVGDLVSWMSARLDDALASAPVESRAPLASNGIGEEGRPR